MAVDKEKSKHCIIMNWDETKLSSLLKADIKLLLENRGGTLKQCTSNKSTMINLLKSKFKVQFLDSSLIIAHYTVKSIKAELKLRKLNTSGTKEQLIKRLEKCVCIINILCFHYVTLCI